MRGLLYRVLLFFAAVWLSACSHHSVHDQQGRLVDLKQHPGKWLIINYWAPWCSACKKELPEINQFYLTYRDRALVYGFDYDHLNRSTLSHLRKQMGIDFPLLSEDPQSVLSIKQDIQSLPITFVYNPKGQLVSVLQGPQTVQTLTLITQQG